MDEQIQVQLPLHGAYSNSISGITRPLGVALMLSAGLLTGQYAHSRPGNAARCD
jgi:hypothetical protein